jgi:hypothetical protein
MMEGLSVEEGIRLNGRKEEEKEMEELEESQRILP